METALRSTARLVIDETATQLDSSFAIRFVEVAGSGPQPVLFRNGKRVTRAWALDMSVECPVDPHGGNANTE